jgi:hypothetical protein
MTIAAFAGTVLPVTAAACVVMLIKKMQNKRERQERFKFTSLSKEMTAYYIIETKE